MIAYIKYITGIAFLLIVLPGCKDKEEPKAVLPTNLLTQITTNSGEVTVLATADNANFYSVTFEENGNASTIESNDGTAVYTYSQAGTYTLTTRAHTTYDAFVEKVDHVTVEINSSPPPGIPTTGYSTPLSYPGYTLVWNDEFNGTSLSNDWVCEIGNGQAQGIPGWGNNELQYYRQENIEVTGGYALIKAKQESFGGYTYTSARAKTQGIQSFEKGRIDIRAALPYGQGIWPALWMLGDNISSVGWPACGEIDIMELVGGPNGDNKTHGTVHWEDQGAHADYGGSNTLGSGIFADEFHVFSIIWDNNQIVWLRDDIQYHVVNITSPEMTEFHQNFFLIMNIAVGGTWPGNPDQTTVFPQTMAVDYIRIFQ